MAREINTSSLLNDANLQGYWRLEDANDSGSNGYNLTNVGTTGFSGAQFSNGAILNGSSKYLTVADASSANLEISGSQTWSVWYKPKALGVAHQILSKRKLSTSSHYRLISLNSDDTFNFNISGLTTNTEAKSTESPTLNAWHHVVGVYDSANSKLKIWVNGVKTEFTASGSGSDTDAMFDIGAVHLGAGDTASGFANGDVDDVAIFNRALSDAEVSALYTDSVSTSLSPSRSPSVSVSSSPSISPSASISLSPSLSGSPSPSRSESSSTSPSSSESRSLSLSPSVSISSSLSPSPSVSISSSISPSQPPGSGLYSKQSSASLPSTKSDLSIIYGEEDETDVSTDNGVRVSIEGDNNYLIHQYKVVNTNSTDSIRVKINLQSSLAPTTSPVYLQVWKVSSSQWETIDTDNTSSVNTDFDLTALIDTNQENYYDTAYEVAFRVYQLRI